MGRKKIKIQPIKEDRNRSVTYLKRKAGLFKKAHELAVLTDSQVAVIVFGHNGKLAEFCSTDIDLLLLRYTEYDGAAERKGPQHYFNLDKDSDDNDDNDDNDNDGPDSGDGPDDSFASHSGANGSTAGRGSTSGASGANNSRSTPRTSGVKRKAEPASPPRTTRAIGVNPAPANMDQAGSAPSTRSWAPLPPPSRPSTQPSVRRARAELAAILLRRASWRARTTLMPFRLASRLHPQRALHRACLAAALVACCSFQVSPARAAPLPPI